ncbi:MAG: DUF2726 domain-containing protein [Azoarcus sp.]|jgi:hypothetical protein|nr:DUF2726 domain-containing protein [Azoarcus sp.]
MGLVIVFVVAGALAVLLLIVSKRVQSRRRAREAAWFAATISQRSGESQPGDTHKRFRSKPVLPFEAARLYFALTEAFPKLIVLSQVGAARVLYLKGEEDWEDQGETARLTVDFLICKASATGIIPTAVIELDSPANNGKERQRLVRQKRQALEEASLPLIVYDSGKTPNVEALRRDVANAVIARGRVAKKTEP